MAKKKDNVQWVHCDGCLNREKKGPSNPTDYIRTCKFPCVSLGVPAEISVNLCAECLQKIVEALWLSCGGAYNPTSPIHLVIGGMRLDIKQAALIKLPFFPDYSKEAIF